MVGVWFAWRAANLRWARAQLGQVVALADAKRYSDAYDLAMAVNPYVSGDPTLTRVMPVISDTVAVKTDPSGATVYLKRFAGGGAGSAPARQLLGTSPLTDVRIARGEYVLSIKMPGYATVERTVSGVVIRAGSLSITPLPIRIDQRLMPAAAVP